MGKRPRRKSLKDRARDVLADLLEAIDGFFAPQPQPQLVPIRTRRRPPR